MTEHKGSMLVNLQKKVSQWYRDFSIAKKISIANIVLTFFLLVLFVILFRTIFEKAVLEIASDGYIQKFDIVSKNCMALFDDAQQLTKFILTDGNIQEWFSESKDSSYSQRLQLKINAEKSLDYIDAIRGNSHFGSLSVFSVDKSTMINSNNIRSQSEVYMNLFLRYVAEGEQNQWVDLYALTDNFPALSGIAYFRPYRDSGTGKIMGYAMVEFDDNILQTNFEQLKYGTLGGFYVADVNGNQKISSNIKDLIDIFSVYPANEWVERCNPNGCIHQSAGTRYLVTAALIETLDWIMFAVVPINELTQKGYSAIQILYIIGFFSILIAIFVSRWIAKKITGSLSTLTETMEKFGEGNLQISVPIKSNDEIGTLSKVFNNMADHIQHLVIQVYQEQRDKRKFEFSALQAQINPHFLYNTLNSVCSLIQMDKREDAFTIIHALSSFYRTALSNGDTIVPIQTEIMNVENYIQIQKMRYEEKISFEIMVDDEILPMKFLKFTLQPLVENAIYHGVKQKDSNGTIRIKGFSCEDKIFIVVSDDGVGMLPEKAELLLCADSAINKTSYGVNNIHRRIKLYFGPEYGLSIQSQPGIGTSVTVIIPKQKND